MGYQFHGPIVRPPTDADSLFIEVTAGCTHNSCTFCNFYKDTPLWVATNEEVEQQLREAKREVPAVGKIWASGGNPFALSAHRLIELGDLFRKYYPMARVSTYARIDDIFRKSVDDLRAIREHGIDDILIGIEPGDDEALSFVNKGYTAEDIVRECHKLDEAGMPYRMIYLGGLLGAGRLVESARKSAQIFNQIHPYYMYYTNVSVLPGTKLHEQMQAGEYQEATEKERLLEMRELIAGLENHITIDSSTAASSVYLMAELPRDKKAALAALDKEIANFTDEDERKLHARRTDEVGVEHGR